MQEVIDLFSFHATDINDEINDDQYNYLYSKQLQLAQIYLLTSIDNWQLT